MAAKFELSLVDKVSGPARQVSAAVEKVMAGFGGLDNSAVINRMEEAARAVGVPLDAMASSISDVADAAKKAQVLDVAKAAFKEMTEPIYEVTEAMERLTKAAHDAEVLKQAKNLMGLDEVTEQMKKLQEQKHASKVLEEAKNRLAKLDPEFGSTAKAADRFKDSMTGMVTSAAPSSGALGALTKALAALGPVGIAITAALVVATAAIMATVGALYAMSKAAIDVIQQRTALAGAFDVLGRGADEGAHTMAILDGLAAKLPFTVQKMSEWAKGFMQASIHGRSLERAIKATAAATAMMGEQGGSAARDMIEQLSKSRASGMQAVASLKGPADDVSATLSKMGLHIEDLTKELGVTPAQFRRMRVSADQVGVALEHALMRKGANALLNMGDQIGTMTEKVKEGVSSLFEGLEEPVQGFQAELQMLFAEFFKGSTTMKVGKSLVTVVLTDLFHVATEVVDGIHLAFLDLEYVFLKVAIALAPLIKGFRKMFGAKDATSAAKAFGTGLRDSVLASIPMVSESVATLANSMASTFARVLKIQSPSRVMMQMGAYVAEGAAIGIESKTDRVESAAAIMGGGAIAGAARGAAPAPSRSIVVNVAEGAVRIDGAGKSAMEITEEMVALVFERFAASQGLASAR